MVQDCLLIADDRVRIACDHLVQGLGKILGVQNVKAHILGYQEIPCEISPLHGNCFAVQVIQILDVGSFRPDKNRCRHIEYGFGKLEVLFPLNAVEQARDNIGPA